MPRHTPWGPSQHFDELGLGLQFHNTAGHGGIFVPKDQLHRIPADQQAWAARWSESPQWYEEDCCIAAVIANFPELFKPKQVAEAMKMVAEYCPASAVSA